MRKPFDSSLFNQNDVMGREAIKRAFSSLYNYSVYDNSDKYGPDLVAFDSSGINHIGFVEVEVKHFWKNSEFPALVLHIPERKRKFLNYQPIIAFCVLNSDCTRGCWIQGHELEQCRIITKANKYMKVEEFFEVPVEFLEFFEIPIA